ncbi:hypothetical protein [Azotobacter beijerinckii]|uniref:hypothetical protein n=1 Tax=Azotobacter beijerinckii TaxID=170623 RepID=UPI00111355A4|nr:hypothetical protein [Azotobacter beijerinckii]
MSSLYRGSLKHKSRPAKGMKGTLCPEWTHSTGSSRLGNDTFQHDWSDTEASRLFEGAVIWEGGRRFATGKGIAFEAKETADGTWHGYPIPWESVPPDIVRRWLKEDLISKKQIKKYKSFSVNNISWALDDDQP